jgi:hypothetical protein
MTFIYGRLLGINKIILSYLIWVKEMQYWTCTWDLLSIRKREFEYMSS